MRREKFVCHICQADSEIKIVCKANLGGEKEYDLVECRSCKVRFLDPLPSNEQLQEFYLPQYYGKDWYKQEGLGRAFARTALRGIKPGRFLDIGCGLGFFIKGIRDETDWTVTGVEFSPEAAEYARENLTLDVHAGDVSDLKLPDGHFDYIQIRNVLEHVTEPRELMLECRRIMKPNGILHLFVPNGPVDSADLVRYFNVEGTAGFSKSGHLFFFSNDSLARLFDDSGFVVVRARTLGLRRGLASLGYWPRLKDWKRFYRIRFTDYSKVRGEITLSPKKNRPDIYYRYRNFRMNAKMLPGFKSWGLDYEVVLKRQTVSIGSKGSAMSEELAKIDLI